MCASSVVLSWRAWGTIDLVGKEHALTLLRQSVRFCTRIQDNPTIGIRSALPKLLEKYKLLGKTPGNFGLADACRPDHQDILRHHLFAQRLVELQAAPAVAQGNGDGALGIVLAHDVAVELGDDFAGREIGHWHSVEIARSAWGQSCYIMAEPRKSSVEMAGLSRWLSACPQPMEERADDVRSSFLAGW